MTLVKYDTEKYDSESLCELLNYIKKEIPDAVFIPKEFDCLLDCPTYELINLKKEIEKAIRAKQIINEM